LAIYDSNQFNGNGIPAAINAKMTQLVNEGHTLRKVVVAPGGGWIIICDDTYWNEGFPQAAYETIDSVRDHGGNLTNVVFDPNGNWALIFDGIAFEQGTSGIWSNFYFGPGFAPKVVSFA
jgi:hypothetical protein